jgi:3'(2'), 5'-bisphosphate nucleotidase
MSVEITETMVEAVVAIAKEAGEEILKVYGTDFAVEAKDDRSPVTAADRAAETVITQAITDRVTDRFPIVGEEAVDAGHIPDVKDTPFWLVDPLDGTKEFIKRNGEFTVNIALIDGARPVLGVVHAPALGATYWGSVLGAFVETDGGPARPMAVRSPAPDGLVVVASRSHRSAELDDYLAGYRVKEEVSTGSSLKFCLVAEARADLYPRLGRTMEWDTAAGQAVVTFSGGRVTGLDGAALTYGKPGFENPHFIVRGGMKSGDDGPEPG